MSSRIPAADDALKRAAARRDAAEVRADERASRLFGAGTAFVGVLVGAAISIFVTLAGFHHDDQQQARTERRDAYVEFLRTAHEHRVTLFEVALVLQRAEAAPEGSPERDKFEREFDDKKLELLGVQLESEQALGLVSISADSSVYGETRRLRDAVSEALGAMPRQVNDVKAAKLYGQKLGELAQAESDFVKAVRDDLK